jgi:hypothetical protein
MPMDERAPSPPAARFDSLRVPLPTRPRSNSPARAKPRNQRVTAPPRSPTPGTRRFSDGALGIPHRLSDGTSPLLQPRYSDPEEWFSCHSGGSFTVDVQRRSIDVQAIAEWRLDVYEEGGGWPGGHGAGRVGNGAHAQSRGEDTGEDVRVSTHKLGAAGVGHGGGKTVADSEKVSSNL